MPAVMLDMETLATTPDTVILTVGAVKFDPYTLNQLGDELYLRLDVNQQLELGRSVSESTLEWWGKQDPAVRDEALGDENRVSVEEFYSQLNRFLVGATDIWCQGPVFDIVILENLYRQMGWPAPWQYWQISDSRTVFKMHGDPRKKEQGKLHNALEDCKSQALAIQRIYADLGIENPKAAYANTK